ncbi:MAG: universal stress protein [Desulfuromonadales bacterium]|nr:universal stress protein [Desulfuromonadales bacterium]
MRILYATDGSSQARAAGVLLAGLNLSPRDKITVLTVDDRRGEVAADIIFRAALEDLSGTLARIDTQTREGYPDEEILNACKEWSADLLTVGAKGASGLVRFLLGGVTARVLRHAPCSVLIVRPEKTSIRRVILALDDSNSARAAAAALTAFPFPAGTEVQLVSVLPFLYRQEPQRQPVYMPSGEDEFNVIQDSATLIDRLLGSGFRASMHLLRGDPAAALLDHCEEQDADLIVMGSHGSSPAERFHRFLLGSVSEKLARYAPCCALVIKQPGE